MLDVRILRIRLFLSSGPAGEGELAFTLQLTATISSSAGIGTGIGIVTGGSEVDPQHVFETTERAKNPAYGDVWCARKHRIKNAAAPLALVSVMIGGNVGKSMQSSPVQVSDPKTQRSQAQKN